MATYIKEVETLEELKQVYKKLALKHHPDCGGDEEAMKLINNEYDSLFEKLKHIHKNKDNEFYEKETTETPEEWREIISQLLNLKMQNVLIEVIGSFLWVSGETKPYKEELKALGLKWGNKKKAWYLSPKGYKRHGKKDYDMNKIRNMYGSQTVKNYSQKQLKEA